MSVNVGLGLTPADNLDALEISDNSVVDFVPPGGNGLPDAPVFFSVDAPTAAALGALPPGGPVTPGSILAWDPATAALYNWAPAAALGLLPGDDIDALAVSFAGGPPIPGGWVGAGTTIVFSLTPGSPSLAGLPTLCGLGAATGGDVFAKVVPGGPPPMPAIDAEMLGLDTIRSGGPGNDDLDGMDIVLASGADADGDMIDDAADMDDDNDGLGDSREVALGCLTTNPDTDGDGLTDYQEVVTYGTNCAVPDTDGDGCTDYREVQTAPGSELSGGRRDPNLPWDYFNPSHDLKNRVDDILLVVSQYFKDDPDATPGFPPFTPGYNQDTDRTLVGPNQWNLGPPNGLQRVDDILNQVKQYFHDCV
jgi:hypothetical protein